VTTHQQHSTQIAASLRELFTKNYTTAVLRPFFRDHPGEPVPEENFWTLWCKGRLTKATTPTIRLGATPSGLTSAHLHHPPHIFYRPDAQPFIGGLTAQVGWLGLMVGGHPALGLHSSNEPGELSQ